MFTDFTLNTYAHAPSPTAIRKNVRAPDTRIFLFLKFFLYRCITFVAFPRFFEYLDFLSPFFLLPGGGGVWHSREVIVRLYDQKRIAV